MRSEHLSDLCGIHQHRLNGQSFLRRRAAVKRTIDEILRKFLQTKRRAHLYRLWSGRVFTNLMKLSTRWQHSSLFKELKSRENVHPVYVDEFHTTQLSAQISCCSNMSQVCALCCEAKNPIYRVVGLGTKQDILRESTNITAVDNHWYVRHCMRCC